MIIDFDKAFSELTGHSHFPWQKRLFKNLSKGNIPNRCNIPTGLGKTSVIALWLLALAEGNQGGRIPCRLVYVVNRRTIVDQSTDVVMRLRNKLYEASGNRESSLFHVAASLRKMAVPTNAENEFFSVSTLRGELADNLEWRFDPLRPAVIIGTVDMIGSKLLFSGYGDSRRTRPLNAGLVGCDTLIVHDEAHLTPAFSRLLDKLTNFSSLEEKAFSVPLLQVLELSATGRDEAKPGWELDDEDYADPTIRARLYAKKELHLHKVEKTGAPLLEKIVQLTITHNPDKKRVVVFVQSPEDATKIHELLLKKTIENAGEAWKKENSSQKISKEAMELLQNQCEASVSILTGEIRGYERDMLLETPGMLPFTGKADAEHTVYLISTSAGEVGMDLHADHMVSDLSTLDSMIQRLGRVNRFGGGKACVDVIYESAIKEDPRKNTRQILSAKAIDTGMDVSPAALIELLHTVDTKSALSDLPEMVDATDILLDLWSQTSLTDIPARPDVAPWLHGIQKDLPETWIAWRQEVPLLASSELEEEDIARWFQICRILSRETLRKPTYRLKWSGSPEKKWLEENRDQPVILLTAKGQAKRMTLSGLAENDISLNFGTIIFPSHLGGLNKSGFFDTSSKDAVPDVTDDSTQKMVLERMGVHYRFKPLERWQESRSSDEGVSGDVHPWTSLRDAMKTVETTFGKKIVFRLKVRQAQEWQDDDDLHEQWLILLKEKQTPGARAIESPTVDEHNQAVSEIINIMAEKLALPVPIREALFLAAKHHDIGKSLDCWQVSAGFDPAKDGFRPRAKPIAGGVDWRKLDGYRHELGSLMKALEIEEIRSHTECNLILHLIAAHHGWARPHFEDRAFPADVDEKNRQDTNLGIMLRFVKLQDRFGYFRLAWLESLLRRADGMASVQHGASEEVSDE